MRKFAVYSLRYMIVISITLLGCGCLSNAIISIEDKQQPPPKYKDSRSDSNASTYIIRSGDTLYSIAWRFDTTVKKLRHFNDLASKDLIFPGQKIHLRRDLAWLRANPLPRALSEAPPNKKPRSQVKIAAKKNQTAKVSAKNESSAKPSLRPVQKKQSAARSKKRSTAKTSTKAIDKKVEKIDWRWPAKGKIHRIGNAQSGLGGGVDIHGKLGDSIHAASHGTVVYSGSGLKDYGKLLIIKHSSRYLTAYAHNDSLLVKEGETVKKGQRIATMGSTGTNKVKLHFEIRENGKSVDPTKLIDPLK